MKNWKIFFKSNDGNSYPHPALVVFFYRRFYKLKKKIDILDLGSGTGSTLMLIKKKNFHIDFVDISKWALKKLIKKKKIHKNNIKTFNDNFNNFLEQSKKKYDLIIDSASLQHQSLKEIKKSFKLINQNLKTKGFFFSISLNSSKGINNENYLVTKLKRKRLISLFKLCNLQEVDYNYYYYTENNSKNFIKFNIITGKKIK